MQVWIASAKSTAEPSLPPVEPIGHVLDRALALAKLTAELAAYGTPPPVDAGEGGSIPAPKDIAAALQFVATYPKGLPVPTAFLGSIGDVGVYWQKDEWYADLYFLNGTISWFMSAGSERAGKPERLNGLKLEDLLGLELETRLAIFKK